MYCLKKLLFPFNTFIVLLVFAYACNIAPGAYPYAELYTIKTNESELIKAVHDFKFNNPELHLPTSSLLRDGRRDSTDNWYHFYFYDSTENRIFKTWVRRVAGSNKKSTLAFVGVNEGLELGNWKMVNKDFNADENKSVKKYFEDRILSGVKEELENTE